MLEFLLYSATVVKSETGLVMLILVCIYLFIDNFFLRSSYIHKTWFVSQGKSCHFVFEKQTQKKEKKEKEKLPEEKNKNL